MQIQFGKLSRVVDSYDYNDGILRKEFGSADWEKGEDKRNNLSNFVKHALQKILYLKNMSSKFNGVEQSNISSPCIIEIKE